MRLWKTQLISEILLGNTYRIPDFFQVSAKFVQEFLIPVIHTTKWEIQKRSNNIKFDMFVILKTLVLNSVARELSIKEKI